MRTYILYASLSFCLLILWLLIRRDIFRLTRPVCRVNARVVGHRISRDKGVHYSAVLSFSHEGGTSEVVDQLRTARPTPPVGEIVEICYPQGRPDLARVPRPLLWIAIYLFVIGLAGVILARIMDWLPEKG